MKDRRIKNYWWENIHQYKGERIPPYHLLSFPSIRELFSVIASMAHFAMRGDLSFPLSLPGRRLR